jgi:protein SCO1/2
MSDVSTPAPFRSALSELLSLKLFWAVIILSVITAVAMRSLVPSDAPSIDPASLPDHGVLPEFSFVDQTGASFSTESLRGKAAIAGFIFTRCPTVCPVVSMKMQRLAEQTARADQLMYLSFSVDPEYDSPDVLREFAAKFDANPAQWKFLTGDPADIRAAVEGSLKVAMDRQGTFDDGAPDIVHGTHLVLLDGNLHIRGYYDYTDPKRLVQLLLDAAALLGN